jgi:DNA polymerase III subunit delta'
LLPMPLPPLTGHSEARRRVAEGLRAGNLPQVLLVTGPLGVGKQRLALWLGQLALCARPGAEPCGTCRSCHMVEGLAHPDLHWLVPIVRPKASEPGKQIEEASEALAAAMADRRRQPLYTSPDGMAIHPIASVRLLLQQAGLSAVEGGWRIFIIGDAERLVPQEASQEAANAMLKLLEEPPPRSLFVLTSTDPRALLPTVRSRTAPVRLNRLSDEEVRGFLERHRPARTAGVDLDGKAKAAGGSIGVALAADDEDSNQAYRAAADLLEAIAAGRGPLLERALKQTPYAARGEFTAMLDALADTLGDAARAALGQPTRRPVPAALRNQRDPSSLLRAMERVSEAREAAWGNVNPQLLLAVLGGELVEVL